MNVTTHSLTTLTIVMLSLASGCVHETNQVNSVTPEERNSVRQVSENAGIPLANVPSSDSTLFEFGSHAQSVDPLRGDCVLASDGDFANNVEQSIQTFESDRVEGSRAPRFTKSASFKLAAPVKTAQDAAAPDFSSNPFKTISFAVCGITQSNKSGDEAQLFSTMVENVNNENSVAADSVNLGDANPESEFTLIEGEGTDSLPCVVSPSDESDWNNDGRSSWVIQDFAEASIDTSARVELNSIDVGVDANLRDEVLPEGVDAPRSMLSQSLIDAGMIRTDEPNDSLPNRVEEDTASEQLEGGVQLLSESSTIDTEYMNLGLGNIDVNNTECALMLLGEYSGRISSFSEPVVGDETVQTTDVCEAKSWWDLEVVNATRENSIPITLDVESLVMRTLQNSKYLQGLADLPVIREKSTMEAIAEFDTTTFMESRFRKRSEPVGNQLTVGATGSNRLREDDFSASAGLTRKTTSGANMSVAQQFGLFTNNSTFLDPKHQGNSRLTLNVTQPLLNGSGRAYNTNLIMLAQMDERLAWDEVSEQLQDYLVEVMEAYWQLYLERARLKQKQQSLSRAENVLGELEHRRDIDAVDSQIASARSAVQNRRTELIRAHTLVRNVESRLRALVNDPSLYGAECEFVPTEFPVCDRFNVSMGDAMSQALESRSEIDKAIQNVRAAGVRLKVAKSELMPVLDLVLETYVSGLRGENNIGRALGDQFTLGEPTYSAGFRYELPWGNRLAENRHDRRRVEMRQAISQFEFQIEELMSEVEIAVREVDTSYEEMGARLEAMSATRVDLEYFMKRWELLPGDDRSASFLLEDILSAQDRLASAESNYAQSQITYTMSIVKAKRALGILMKAERIEAVEQCEAGLPRYIFEKNNREVFEFIESSIPITVQESPISAERNVIEDAGGLIGNQWLIDDQDRADASYYLDSTDHSPRLVPYSIDPHATGIPIDAPVRLGGESTLGQDQTLMKGTR